MGASVKRHRDILELYCIPVEEASSPSFDMASQDKSGWQYGMDLSADWTPNDADRRIGSGRSGGLAGRRAWDGGFAEGGMAGSNSKYTVDYGSGVGDVGADT